ncbi:MAG TPA: DUF748 domain-containing protein, partial [Candidatus Polarisedimenticolaceae bacterium]|nr:DUF748 domain-containing protein [Candidatus Polarisedimenticolaceae bacterium]
MDQIEVRRFVHRRRRWLVAGAVLFACYTVGGFFVVPRIAEQQVVAAFDETLGLGASVGRLRTNPFSFTIRANDFVLRDPTGDELLGFDELFVNWQLSSLFRWAWTFKQVRLAGPRVVVIVEPDGSLNLRALVPRGEPRDAAAETGSLPRLLVRLLQVDAAIVNFEDRTRPEPFRTVVGPAGFTLERFSTLPDRAGEFAFEANAESGARLAWQGTIAVNPFHSRGSIELAGAQMPITKRYLQDRLRFHVPQGSTDSEWTYEVSIDQGGLNASVRDGSVVVRDLRVTAEDGASEVLRLPELRIAGIGLAWPERRLSVDEITLGGGGLSVWRAADGTINLLGPASERAPAEAGTAPPPFDWELSLGRLAVDDFAIGVEDRAVDPPFRTGLSQLAFDLREVDNRVGSSFPFTLALAVDTGGTATSTGRLGALPAPTVDAAVRVDELSLVPLQAYLDALARLRIDSGSVSIDGQLDSGAEELLRYRGRLELVELSCHDVQRDERLVAVGRLGAEDLLLEATAARLRVASVELERPYGRLTIYEDGSTNVGGVLATGEESTETAGAADTARPVTIEVGELRIGDGSADFADLSLPLPFASRIESLDGAVSEMATGGTSARVELEGTVDEYGLARVEGSLDLFAPDRRSDVAVIFRNVEMNPLSPYSSKFAGYTIEEGRLSLDLRYRIEDRTLDSDNAILIERLTLGEKVDSPDAPNLPVKLAVALLKDSRGNIELDIPVGGTLDDPEFAYGKLVWKAIKNVLTKVATAPFRALAGLIGSDKDLEFVEFAPATSEIAPPAREKLDELARALVERPELVLEVAGVYDPEIDADGMRKQKLAASVAQRVAAGGTDPGAEPTL